MSETFFERADRHLVDARQRTVALKNEPEQCTVPNDPMLRTLWRVGYHLRQARSETIASAKRMELGFARVWMEAYQRQYECSH